MFAIVFLASFLNSGDPAKIANLESEHEVAAQQRVSLHCNAEGNPQPTYAWTPCDPQQNVCHESVLNVPTGKKSVYTFTCKVENNLGSDRRNSSICKLVKKYIYILQTNNFPFVRMISFYLLHVCHIQM